MANSTQATRRTRHRTPRRGQPTRAFWLVLCLALLVAGCEGIDRAPQPLRPVPGGDAARGAQAIRAYGCGSCHRIPGVPGANAMAAPPLDGWVDRSLIAGLLPNEAEYLQQWIRYPQAIEPGTAMPNMGVTEQDARDISAYLYTLTGDR